jgi:hypothetical protein
MVRLIESIAGALHHCECRQDEAAIFCGRATAVIAKPS